MASDQDYASEVEDSGDEGAAGNPLANATRDQPWTATNTVPMCFREAKMAATKTNKKTNKGRDRIGVVSVDGFEPGDRITIGSEVGFIGGITPGFLVTRKVLGNDWPEGTPVQACNQGPTTAFEVGDWVANRHTGEFGQVLSIEHAALEIKFDGAEESCWRVPDNYDIVAPKAEPGSEVLVHSISGNNEHLNGKRGTLDKWIPMAGSWKINIDGESINVNADNVHVIWQKQPTLGALVVINGFDEDAEFNNACGRIEAYEDATKCWRVKIPPYNKVKEIPEANLQVMCIEANSVQCRDGTCFDHDDIFCKKCGLKRPKEKEDGDDDDDTDMCFCGTDYSKMKEIVVIAKVDGVHYRKMCEREYSRWCIERGIKDAILDQLDDFSDDNMKTHLKDYGEQFHLEIEITPPDGVGCDKLANVLLNSRNAIQDKATEAVKNTPDIGQITTATIRVTIELQAQSTFEILSDFFARQTAHFCGGSGEYDERPEEEKTKLCGVDVSPVADRMPNAFMEVRPEVEPPKTVNITTQVQGVDFVQLAENPDIEEGFDRAMRQTVIDQCRGRVYGLTQDNIKITRAEGSDITDINITPPPNVEASKISAILSDTNGMQDRATDNISKVPNIDVVQDEQGDGQVHVLAQVPEVIHPAARDHVLVNIKIEGVKYGPMVKEPKIVEEFEKAIKRAVVDVLDGLNSEDSVTLTIHEGIVVVVDIEPPGGVSPNNIRTALIDSNELLRMKVIAYVKKVPGIAKVRSGPVNGSVGEPRIVEPRPKPNDRVHFLGLNTCSYKRYKEIKDYVTPAYFRSSDGDFDDDDDEDAARLGALEEGDFALDEICEAETTDDQWVRVRVKGTNMDKSYRCEVIMNNEDTLTAWPVVLPAHMRGATQVINIPITVEGLDLKLLDEHADIKAEMEKNIIDSVEERMKQALTEEYEEIEPGFVTLTYGEPIEEGIALIAAVTPNTPHDKEKVGEQVEVLANSKDMLRSKLDKAIKSVAGLDSTRKFMKPEEEERLGSKGKPGDPQQLATIITFVHAPEAAMLALPDPVLTASMSVKVIGITYGALNGNPEVSGEALIEAACKDAILDVIKIDTSFLEEDKIADKNEPNLLTDELVHIHLSEGLTVKIVIIPPAGVSANAIVSLLYSKQDDVTGSIVDTIRERPGVEAFCNKNKLIPSIDKKPEVDMPAPKNAETAAIFNMLGGVPAGMSYSDMVNNLDNMLDLEEEANRDGQFVDWEIDLVIKKGSPPLGITPNDADGKTLVVQEVHEEGTIPEFNNENPNRALVKGDRIVRMNRVEGSSEKLLKEGAQLKIHKWVIRRQAEEAAAALGHQLQNEKPREIKKRLRELKVSEDEIQKCDEVDDVKSGLCELVIRETRVKDAWDFEIEIEKKAGQLIGLVTKADDNDKTVIISNIKEHRAIAHWNKEHPDRQVRIGDRIVEMNGVKGDPDRLQYEIGTFKDTQPGMNHWLTIRKCKVSAKLDAREDEQEPEALKWTARGIEAGYKKGWFKDLPTRCGEPFSKQHQMQLSAFETIDDLVKMGYLEPDIWMEPDQFLCLFRLDNRECRMETRGLCYYLTPHHGDGVGDGNEDCAKWGTWVLGLDMNSEWIKVGERFLPKNMNECQVLHKEQWEFKPQNKKPLELRQEPNIAGAKAQHKLSFGDTFFVSEEKQVGQTLFLKLADGRGWVYEEAPLKGGVVCYRTKPLDDPIETGSVVEVLVAFETANSNPIKVEPKMKGTVVKMDDDGDAHIQFDKIRSKQWVKSIHFPKLHVEVAQEDDFEQLNEQKEDDEMALRLELQCMKVSDLKKRAKLRGMPQDTLDEADDSDNPKEYLVDMLCKAEAYLRVGSRVTILQDMESTSGTKISSGRTGRITELEDGYCRIKFKGGGQKEWVSLQDMKKMKIEAPRGTPCYTKYLGITVCEPEVSDMDEEEEPSDHFYVGSRVVIFDMPDDEEEDMDNQLNGKEGRITSWEVNHKQWLVELSNGQLKMIPKDNLKHAEVGICEKNHLLFPIKYPGQYSCSCCEKIFPEAMYECGKCDSGICSNCMRLEVATCKRGHVLVPLGTTMDNGWSCNGHNEPGGCLSKITAFSQSTGINRFRCKACDYDLCEKCCKKMCQEQNSALGMTRAEFDVMREECDGKDKTIQKIKTDIEYAKRGEDEPDDVDVMDLSYADVVVEAESTKPDKPVPEARKMLLWAIKQQAEEGDVPALGWFASEEDKMLNDARAVHKGKSKEQAQKEYKEEWKKQKAQFCVKKPPQFEVGNEVKHKIRDEFGIVTDVEANLLWMMTAGNDVPIPKLRTSYKVSPKEMFVVGQDVRVRNKGDSIWLKAIVTCISPLEARPAYFDGTWQWDEVEALVKSDEPVRAYDVVTVVDGEFKGRQGIAEMLIVMKKKKLWEILLESGRKIRVPMEFVGRKSGLNINDRVAFTEGPYEGQEGIAERYTPAWREWEVRLKSGQYVFASPKILHKP